MMMAPDRLIDVDYPQPTDSGGGDGGGGYTGVFVGTDPAPPIYSDPPAPVGPLVLPVSYITPQPPTIQPRPYIPPPVATPVTMPTLTPPPPPNNVYLAPVSKTVVPESFVPASTAGALVPLAIGAALLVMLMRKR